MNSKTTENNICFINPLIDKSLQELFRITRPNFCVNDKLLTYSHSDIKECPLHKYPSIFVRVYHNSNGTFYGYRDICLCLNCLTINNLC